MAASKHRAGMGLVDDRRFETRGAAQLCVEALRGDSAPASRLPCDPRDAVGKLRA